MRLAGAEALLAAVREHAGNEALRLSAVVVDGRGHEVAGARMDGATWFTLGVARGKARTAAWFDRASGDLAPLRATYPEVFRLAGAQLPEPPTDLPGGVPIHVDGVLVGAIGVSGGTPEQDVAAALAAIETCRAVLRDSAMDEAPHSS